MDFQTRKAAPASWKRITVLTALAWSLLGPGSNGSPLMAQGPGTPRPTVSPYLQLGRRDASPGLLYFNQVRPQQRFLNQLQQQQTSLNTLSIMERRRQTTLNREIQTGHQTHFGNYGGYFTFPAR